MGEKNKVGPQVECSGGPVKERDCGVQLAAKKRLKYSMIKTPVNRKRNKRRRIYNTLR